MCKVYTGYNGTSEIEHGLCACMVINPPAKAPGLSLHTGPQTTLYLSHEFWPLVYHIYPAIRRDFCPSRMTSNN